MVLFMKLQGIRLSFPRFLSSIFLRHQRLPLYYLQHLPSLHCIPMHTNINIQQAKVPFKYFIPTIRYTAKYGKQYTLCFKKRYYVIHTFYALCKSVRYSEIVFALSNGKTGKRTGVFFGESYCSSIWPYFTFNLHCKFAIFNNGDLLFTYTKRVNVIWVKHKNNLLLHHKTNESQLFRSPMCLW